MSWYKLQGDVRYIIQYLWRKAPSAPHTWPTQQLSRPPPIQKLGAENHMLQLNIWCSWWWACVPEICRAKNTLIKLPCCIKLAFQIISGVMDLLAVLYIVCYEVNKCKFIMTICGFDCQKGGTSSLSSPGCDWLCDPTCGYCELLSCSRKPNTYLHLAKR